MCACHLVFFRIPGRCRPGLSCGARLRELPAAPERIWILVHQKQPRTSCRHQAHKQSIISPVVDAYLTKVRTASNSLIVNE
jgi:hypothetical protein